MIAEEKYQEALKLARETNLKRTEICSQCGLDYPAFAYFLKTRHPELVKPQRAQPLSDYNLQKKKEAEKKYRKAIKLYGSTTLSVKDIAEQTGVSLSGLKTHIENFHRDLMLARKDIKASKKESRNVKLREKSGQTTIAHDKYKDAIAACDSEQYITLSVKAIAEKFNVNVIGLYDQLNSHFPEILKRRDEARFRLGIVIKTPKGVRQSTVDRYAPAVEMLKDYSVTVRQAAETTNVPYGGLREYLITYKKDLLKEREKGRMKY